MSLVGTQARFAARSAPSSDQSTYAGVADGVLRFLLLLYLTSMAAEGPLRYGLSTAGLPNALYLRDAIPAGSLLFLFLRELWTARSFDMRIVIPAAALLGHASYAAIAGIEWFPILFGLKIFVVIPYGMAMWPLLRERFDGALTAAAVLYALTLAGVGVNMLLGRMPWEGLSYDTAFGPATTTREWWIAANTPRLPGLARTSFNAAMILGITGLLTAIKFPSVMVRLGLAILTLLGVVATTSKGMVLAYVIAATWLIADPRARHPLVSRTMTCTLAAVTLVVPTVIVLLDLGSGMDAGNFPDLLLSVWERFSSMWPQAFEILPPGPAALLGAGVGSIGTPQEFGMRSHVANAADSLAIYLIVNFGLAGILYYCLPAVALVSVQRVHDRRVQQAFTVLLLVAYGYGVSVNMLEDSFFSICIGVAAGSAWAGRAKRMQDMAAPGLTCPAGPLRAG